LIVREPLAILSFGTRRQRVRALRELGGTREQQLATERLGRPLLRQRDAGRVRSSETTQ
jgi:hypothetical protein